MKQLLLVFAGILLSFATYAQDLVPFSFGPMLGMNSLSLDASPSYDQMNPGSGYAAGAFVRLSGKKWYLQPEVYYSQKSCVLTSYANGLETSAHVKLKSTDIDLIIGHRLIKLTDLAYFRIFAGPGVSLFHDSKYKLNSATYADHDINNSSINGSAGLGFDLLKFSFDLRYQRGFTDLDKTDGATLYTNTILFTAAFKIL